MARAKWSASDWGVPDWGDPVSYDRYNRMTMEQTHWEFLRRHPSFRGAWQACMRDKQMRVAIDWETDFGIVEAHDPTTEKLPRFAAREAIPTSELNADGSLDATTAGFLARARDKGAFLVSWDPKLSPERNMLAVKAGVMEWAEEFEIRATDERDRVIEYPKYLMILDAYDSGASFNAIADSNIFEGRILEYLDTDDLHKLHKRARVTMERLTNVPYPKRPRGRIAD